MKKSGARGASPGELDCAGLRVQLLAADGDRIGDAIVGIEALQLRLEPVIHGAVLRGAVGDDEDLRAALLQYELCRPRPRMLEGRRVLRLEKLADLT